MTSFHTIEIFIFSFSKHIRFLREYKPQQNEAFNTPFDYATAERRAGASVALGSASPAGSSGPSLTATNLTSPLTAWSANRLHRPMIPTEGGPGCVIFISNAAVKSPAGSPKNLIMDPPIF